jgi:hypothetical protein
MFTVRTELPIPGERWWEKGKKKGGEVNAAGENSGAAEAAEV